MATFFKRWFSAPTFAGDKEKTQKARLLHVVILTTMVYIILVIGANFIGGRFRASIILLDIGIFLVSLGLYLLLQRGKIALVGLSYILCAFFFVISASISLGTIRTPTTASFMFIVLFAGMLFNLRGIVLTTLASSLTVMGLIIAENAGALPQPDYAVTFTQWFTFTGLFAISGAITYFAVQSTNKALAQANKELAQREQIEQALLAKTQELDNFFTTSLDLFCIADTDGFFQRLNDEWENTLGYSLAEMQGKPFLEFVHPDDRKATLNAVSDLRAQKKVLNFENRYLCKDGSYRWIEWRSMPCDKLIFAAARDISERKKAEVNLRTSEARFRSLFEQSHDAVFILSLDERILDVNQRATQMLGYSLEELKEFNGQREIFASNSMSENSVSRLLAGEQLPLIERMFRNKDGQTFPVEINVELVRDNSHHPLHIQAIVRDISSRKQNEEALRAVNEQLTLRVAEIESLQDELREQALRDPLTNLYNRRYLMETLEREITRVKREKQPLGIIVMDIDRFKNINDTYGHHAGDVALKTIANLLVQHARGSDFVCRYGGEEFLLVLPGASLESTKKRAEEIRCQCAGTKLYDDKGRSFGIKSSFGVAAYPVHGQRSEEIINRADKALYISKNNGRNQVTVWDGTQPLDW